MAPLIRGCCCFTTLESGSRASGYFTVVTGIINLIIDIWALVHLHWFEANLEPNEKWAFMPPGLLVFIYLEVACNIGMVCCGLCLMVGLNRGYNGGSMITSWKIGVIFFRLYEVGLGTYILAWIGGHRVSDLIYMEPSMIIIAFYWCLNTVFLIAAVICVSSYWDETKDAIYGRQRRAKFYTMLTNLRSAATGRRPGTATPGYSQLGMSHASFGMSQASMGQPHSQYAGSQGAMGGVPPNPRYAGQHAQQYYSKGSQQQLPPSQQQLPPQKR